MAEPLALGLEFANTAGWHAGPSPEEQLVSYRAALSWAREAEVLSEAEVDRLGVRAEAQPEEARNALERIISMREAVYRIFAAVAQCRHPDGSDLDILHAALREGLPHLRIVALQPAAEAPSLAQADECHSPASTRQPDGGRFHWTWADLDTDLAAFLWPVAGAAATLLTSAQVERVRMCADETCGWLFADHSKNASRRWCDMGDCGNRAKARRYRARQKAVPGS